MATLVRQPIIATGRLRGDSLAGRVAIVTGAGGGIGLEAARSLIWLGAQVVIAEVDEERGSAARAALAAEFGPEQVASITTDITDDGAVERLVAETHRRFGRVDVVINNATFAPFGRAVAEAPIAAWDHSYAVNLRGPVLLARACLPEMVARGRGVFVCVSSTGGPFLAPYETLKAAQAALANALDAELEGTGVVAFTIGPGLVATDTAAAAIRELAPRLGMSVDEFWQANAGAVLSAEAAGAGFAAAVAQASRYAGQEISSSQALTDAGVALDEPAGAGEPVSSGLDAPAAASAADAVRSTLAGQAAEWKQRSFFERQWMLRDFKQRAGMPVERCLEELATLTARLAAGDSSAAVSALPWLAKLIAFYEHLGELARGYVKDPAQREEQLGLVARWRDQVASLRALLQARVH